jgi:hypothetical protein
MTSSIITNPTFATGDTIEAVFANNLRDSDLVLDTRTGGDPGGAGLFLVSTGLLGGGWRVLATGDFPAGVIPDTAMANQKLSLTGGTMSGPITLTAGQALKLGASGSQFVDTTALVITPHGDTMLVTDALGDQMINLSPAHFFYLGSSVVTEATIGSLTALNATNATHAPSGITFANGSIIADSTALIAQAHGNTFLVLNADGSVQMLNASPSGLLINGSLAITTVTIGAQTVAAAGTATTATSATTATTATTANAIADGAVSTTAKLANSIVTDAKVATANKDGTTTTPSMRTLGTGAAQAAAGHHSHTAGGTYTGQGAGINAAYDITVSAFTPVFTVITGSTDDSSFLLVGTADAIGNTAGLAALCTGTKNGTNKFHVDVAHGGPNQSGVSYTWQAFG